MKRSASEEKHFLLGHYNTHSVTHMIICINQRPNIPDHPKSTSISAFASPLAVRNVLEARLLWKIGNLNGLFQYFTFYEWKKGHPTGSQGSETKQKLGPDRFRLCTRITLTRSNDNESFTPTLYFKYPYGLNFQ